MGSLIILIFTTITASLAQSQPYTNTPITTPSGLYFEGVAKVRMVKGHWNILTSLDIEDIYRHSEPLTAVNSRYSEICFEIVSECRLYYLKLYKWHLADLDIRTRWEQLKDFLRPLGTSSEADYLHYSSSIPAEEGDYLNSILPYSPSVKYADNQKRTTHIPSALKDIVRTLDVRKQQVKESLRTLTEKKDSPNEIVDLVANITETTDSIVELRIHLYESLTEVITSIKAGLIHPLTFTHEELRKTLTILSNAHQDLILPVPNDSLGLIQIQDFALLKTIIKNGRIIIIITLSFVEKVENHLYYIHSHPTLQHVGETTEVFGQVRSQFSFILVKNHTQQYAYLSSQYLTDACKRNGRYMICNPSLAFYPMNDEADCEASLLKGMKPQPHLKCDITILHPGKSQWITLNKPGEWLYSLLQPTSGQIICNNHTVINITLSRYGKLTLRNGCELATSHLNLMSPNTMVNTTFLPDIIPNKTLVISELFPEINNHEQLFQINSGNRFTQEIPILLIMKPVARRNPENSYILRVSEPDWSWRIMALVALVMSSIVFSLACTNTVDYCVESHNQSEEDQIDLAETILTPNPSPTPPLLPQRITNNLQYSDYDIPPPPVPIPSPKLTFKGPGAQNDDEFL